MNYAIEQLEETEALLKDFIETFTIEEVESMDLRKKLSEVQMGILSLEASRALINLGVVRALSSNKGE